jgi:hypothetical protein
VGPDKVSPIGVRVDCQVDKFEQIAPAVAADPASSCLQGNPVIFGGNELIQAP